MKYSAADLFSGPKTDTTKATGGLSVPAYSKQGNLGTRGMTTEQKVSKQMYIKKAVDPIYDQGYKASWTEVYSKNGVPVLKSVTYVDRDGNFRTIENVPYVREPGTTYNGIPSVVMIKETNPLAAANGNPAGVYAFAGRDSVALVNQALPQEIKIKSGHESTGKVSSDPCLAEKIFGSSKEYLEAQAKGYAGDISDRSDLLIQQGKAKRSPSTIIDESNGAIYIADSTGKQSLKLANGAATFTSAEFNTGSAIRTRNSVMQDNPVNDTLPTSTILTPQPVLIPHFAKLTNTVLSIMDFIDLIKAMKAAVKVISAEKNDNKEEANRQTGKVVDAENSTGIKQDGTKTI